MGSGLAQIGALARMAERRTGKGELPAEQVAKVKAISQELEAPARSAVLKSFSLPISAKNQRDCTILQPR